jgi:hypothetical protein
MGVILLEPNDTLRDIKSLNGGHLSYHDQYEEVGNYLYRISLREILKSSWSLYLERVYCKGFNDPYKVPFKFDEWIKEKATLDKLGSEGLRAHNLLAIYVEKNGDISSTVDKTDFDIYRRPKNPFEFE